MSEDTILSAEEIINKEKTKQETDKKCPACGGGMDFDPGTGGLLCGFCNYSEQITDNPGAQELDFLSAAQTANCDWGVEKKTVTCKSCGAVSVYDELQLSSECPYCGSNQVMEEKAEDTMAPGGVCPFKVDKKTAGENFTRWLKKKWFCPGKAKKNAKAEAFKGVYLPYWTFDCNTQSSYTARYGIDRTVTDGKGNSKTVTNWYSTSGYYEEFIDDQLVMGTTRHDENLMRRVEPFDTAANVGYKPEYVAGFISERYSVGLKQAWEKAKAFIKSRLESSITSKIRREKHADHVSGLAVKTQYADITYKYLLLPVWLSSFAYKSKIFQFMVNGQTGKVGGKAPVSALRVTAFIVVLLVVIGLLYYFLQNY